MFSKSDLFEARKLLENYMYMFHRSADKTTRNSLNSDTHVADESILDVLGVLVHGIQMLLDTYEGDEEIVFTFYC